MVTKNIFSQGSKKLLNYFPKISNWLNHEYPIPITLEIQLTERCNHHCPNCQSFYVLSKFEVLKRARQGIDLDINILDSIWEQPPNGIVISGNTGEPLLHPQILQILQVIEEHKIPTVLITNGELLSPSISNQLIRTCRGIRISLDAYDSVSYSNAHGIKEVNWEITNHNIRDLINIRNGLDISKKKCAIGIGYLTQNCTRQELNLAINHAISLNVDYIQFRPFHHNSFNILKTLEELLTLETDHFKIYCSSQKYSNMDDKKKEYKKCHGAWFYTVLDARGDIYLCCHNVGNPMAKICSLKEISWSEYLKSKERKSIIDNFDISKCIPLCRLDSHNSVLQNILDRQLIPSSPDDEFINWHSPFL